MLPSVILLISVFLAIHIVLPVGTYLLFAGRHDDKTRLWFFAIMILCFGMCLVIIRPFLPSFFGHEFPWFCTFLAWMVMIEVLRRERGLPKTNWIRPALLLGAWITYQSFLYYFQLTASIGLTSQALSVVVLCSVLYWQVLKLCKHVDGKSLFLLKLSMVLYILPNIVRVIEFIRTGNQEVMDVFKFSWSANLVSGSYVFAIMSLCFGYWGFTLEKLMRERNLAKSGQREAEADSEMMRELLQERDQLLVMNSRFSVISALSSFSAMLIHDISQPLQTLQLGLERVRASLGKGASRSQLADDLMHLERASDRAAVLVSGLRSLMQSGESQAVPVLIKPVLDQVREMLSTEAFQKRVVTRLEIDVPDDSKVMADKVMLQRILVNVLSNSLNQFSSVHPISQHRKWLFGFMPSKKTRSRALPLK